jgi:hypothetical protein
MPSPSDPQSHPLNSLSLDQPVGSTTETGLSPVHLHPHPRARPATEDRQPSQYQQGSAAAAHFCFPFHKTASQAFVCSILWATLYPRICLPRPNLPSFARGTETSPPAMSRAVTCCLM